MVERTRVIAFEWAQTQDLSEFAGEWILVFENKIISHGKDAKKLLLEFKKTHSGKRPFIMRVGSEHLALW